MSQINVIYNNKKILHIPMTYFIVKKASSSTISLQTSTGGLYSSSVARGQVGTNDKIIINFIKLV